MNVDWIGVGVWGVCATVVLTSLMALSQALGFSRVALPYLLGTVFTARRARAMWLGMLVHGAIGLVDLEAPPELLASALGSLRIFAGYAGWGPGQLEDELVEGAWYVVESEPGDVSSPSPETLWREVLRRQRNELAMVATYPDDPSLN